MTLFCAHCYATVGTNAAKRCGQCRKRTYCSKVCQVADWRSGHQRWCGKTAEIGHGYEVRPLEGKGLGVIATCAFKKFDNIIVERALLRKPYRPSPDAGLAESESAALRALTPADGGLLAKMLNNQMGCGSDDDDDSGVFVTMSRINHSCMPNAEHYFSDKDKVKRVFACRDIQAGEEICIAYIDSFTVPTSQRRQQLQARYGINCRCAACLQPELAAQLDRLVELDGAVPQLAQQPRTLHMAIAKGEEVIKLLDSVQSSLTSYARAYYDLFQISILKPGKYHAQAVQYIKSAAEYGVNVFGDGEPQTLRYQALAANPQQHRNYGLMG